MYYRHTQCLDIHPDSEDNVATTREQLQNQAGGENSIRTGGRRANHRNNGQLQCPICLGDAVFAVETNCGHVYCGMSIEKECKMINPNKHYNVSVCLSWLML